MKKYSSVNLSIVAMRPKTADFLMLMNLGENYSKKLVTFINKNFEIHDFKCYDNDIVKEFWGVTPTGTLKITLSMSIMQTNVITLEHSGTAITKNYENFSEFDTTLKLFESELCNGQKS